MNGKKNDANTRPGTAAGAAFKILTVGDGDLTLSLALKRAYGSQIELTATTLAASHEELCATYSNSAKVVDELIDRKATVEYGIDATKLTSYPPLMKKEFHLVLFHHPHLGLIQDDEQYHAHKHFVLLAHYLASAKALLRASDDKQDPYIRLIHLCLAHKQPETWNLEEASLRQGLRLVTDADTSVPFHQVIEGIVSSMGPNKASNESRQCLEPLPTEAQYKAPRRFRNGKLGSKHYLANYGYMHRRTHGDRHAGRKGDMNVQGSRHFFFSIEKDECNRSLANDDPCCCSVCGTVYSAQLALLEHQKVPGLPGPPTEQIMSMTQTSKTVSMPEKKFVPASSSGVNGVDAESGAASASSCSMSLKRSRDILASNLTTTGREEIAAKSQRDWVVSTENDGKRLRHFMHRVAMPGFSRKQNDRLIANGDIMVNGTLALDTSRILSSGDVVSMKPSEKECLSTLTTEQSTKNDISIVASYPTEKELHYHSIHPLPLPREFILVAHKPVGVRNKGNSGCVGTLEQIVSRQRRKLYKSLSALDTGCPGLSVFQLQDEKMVDDVELKQEFTALVHGCVPEEWNAGILADVPWKAVRQWKRRTEAITHNTVRNGVERVSEIIEGDAGGDAYENDESNYRQKQHGLSPVDSNTCVMEIQCIERTSQENASGALALSTLKISTGCVVSGLCRAICLFLRKQRYPVVGDHQCQKEYIALPRSIRNRIKKKLCLGCYKVNIDATMVGHKKADKNKRKITEARPLSFHWVSSMAIPDRLRATHWQEHWENASLAPEK